RGVGDPKRWAGRFEMPTISRTRARIPATVHPLLLLMAVSFLGVGELLLQVRRAGADEKKDQGPVVQQARPRSEDDARDRMAEVGCRLVYFQARMPKISAIGPRIRPRPQMREKTPQ